MLSRKDLIETAKTSFVSIKEVKKRQRPISLVDTLMSSYALYSLKGCFTKNIEMAKRQVLDKIQP